MVAAKRRAPQVAANELIKHDGIRQKLDTKIDCKSAIKADESAVGALDKLIEAYTKTVDGIKASLATEVAPEEDATAAKPAEVVGEVVAPAAGDETKDDAAAPAAAAPADAKPEPQYILTKYERIEFEDLLKAHTARLDALKACKAEVLKAPTPKAMTETPLEKDAMRILSAKHMVGK